MGFLPRSWKISLSNGLRPCEPSSAPGATSLPYWQLKPLPALMADDVGMLSLRESSAFDDRNWEGAKELIGKMQGKDNGDFAYSGTPVPVGCYDVLLARVEGDQAKADSRFVPTRERLNQTAHELSKG